MASNLKPAPLSLTEDVVAKLAGERPAFGKGIVRVPVASFRLVDGKKRIDLNTVPSAMEMRAASWRKPREGSDG
tara:strand:+ start:2444 stop:2665 length:222 start_codon:yes stop_codon:yes gene_type:complete